VWAKVCGAVSIKQKFGDFSSRGVAALHKQINK